MAIKISKMQFCNSLFVSIFIIALPVSNVIALENCTYTTYKWNVYKKKALDTKKVQHPYSNLEEFEVDPATGCTVCEEDQEIVEISGIRPFRICKKFALEIQKILTKLNEEGFPFNKIVGYRVGMTRGKIDENGNRTKMSNHSFGIAIDINENQNGLYDRCIEFNAHCRLIRGGEWNPEVEGTLTSNGPVVKLMKQAGFKWGGEIEGHQKDFMHFSPTGY